MRKYQHPGETARKLRENSRGAELTLRYYIQLMKTLIKNNRKTSP